MTRRICTQAALFHWTFVAASLISISATARSADGDLVPFTRTEAAEFLAAMVDDVERWHLKTDPNSDQKGTLNEFVVRTRLKGPKLPETNQGQWGQWVQASLGDTYHSGAYYTAAMIHAWRATGEDRYRTAAKTQQLPLIIRMARNSDTLFPNQVPTVRAGVELNIRKPMKGYIPFWWDDGSSVFIGKDGENINERQPVEGGLSPNPENRRHGYPRRISQHLAQSLGVMFLEAFWMTPQERNLIEAVRLHQEFYEQTSPWGNMWTVAGVAGYICGDEKWLRSANVLASPRQAALNCRTYVHYPRDKRFQAPSFADGTHYRYYADLAKNHGQLSAENTLFLVSNGLNHSLITEAWSDDPAFQPGMERYDRGAGSWYIFNGKPVKYRSEQDRPLGSRVGPQHLALTALALQALRKNSEVWDALPRQDFPEDLVAPIRQGPNSKQWSKPWISQDGTTLEVAADRHGFKLRGKSSENPLALRVRLVFDEVKEGERIAEGRFELFPDGKVNALNDAGESLTLSLEEINRQGKNFSFELHIPYTRVKGQNEWINGADHHRIEVSIGNQTQTYYLLTPSDEARSWMENYLARGLANWRTIFVEKGYIPAALNRPVSWGDGDKREVSHLYGYAFLTSACASYILYLDGKNYWDLLPKPQNHRP